MSATAVLLGLAVILGALTQRLTGVGFALVASPFLVLILGPLQGVVITNIFGVATAMVVFLMHARHVEYRRVLPLMAAAILAIAPGAYLSRTLPAPMLAIGAGALVLLALALSTFARRIPHVDRWPGLIGAGALSGFMNVLAGVGGPAVTAYAVASRWDHARFAVSVQFYFAVIGTASFVSRGHLPDLDTTEWIVAASALILGMAGGQWLSRVVPARTARVFCLVVAALGGVAVIVDGAAALV